MSGVLVTGAAGSVGARVVSRLVLEGRQVTALARTGNNLFRLADVLPRISVARADLMSAAEVRDLVLQMRPEAVLHLGWQGVKGGQRNSSAQVENLLASINLYHAARDSGCRTMVGMGSQAEYGATSGKLSEDAPTRPSTTYGAAKLATGVVLERMAQADGMHFAWLRLFSSYGPGDDPEWLLQHVARRLVAGERPATTAAQQFWDYIHVDDVATAVIAAMDAHLSGFYNLGSGSSRKLEEILLLLRDIVDPTLAIGIGELPYGPEQIWHLEADIGKLQDKTGWKPAVKLEQGLGGVVDWIREHG